MAAAIFVAFDGRDRIGVLPRRGHVLEGFGRDLTQHRRGDSDVGDAHVTAMQPSRQQQMRGLAAEERDGLYRAYGRSHHGPRGAIDAAWQIDSQHRRTVGVDRLDHVERLALDRAVEARPEQRVDDERRPADGLRVERQHRIFPAPRRRGGIALQAVALAQENDGDVAAARGEFGRRHEAVAPVIAGTGDHQDRPVLDKVHRRCRDRLSGAQHQREARRSGRDREPVGTLHLSGRQNFHA